jgi:hypothetical protein
LEAPSSHGSMTTSTNECGKCRCGAEIPEPYEFCSSECKANAPHREINCPRCEGPVCKLDGNGPEKVFTLVYNHRHGSDVGVYKTREAANNAAHQLAYERVNEEWDDEAAKDRFMDEDDACLALDIFDEVEMDRSDYESLEIGETEIRS